MLSSVSSKHILMFANFTWLSQISCSRMKSRWCGGLTLAKGQTPTQPLSHSPFSAGRGEKIGWESSWVELKTERLLTNYCCLQNRLNLIYWQLKYIQVMRNKDKKFKNTFPSSFPRLSFTPDSSTPTWVLQESLRGMVSMQQFRCATPSPSHFLPCAGMGCNPSGKIRSSVGSPWAAVPIRKICSIISIPSFFFPLS